MTGSPNSASPPRPWPAIAAAILACCLAGYAVTISLLHRSGTLSTRAAAAAALAVVVLLRLAWRASVRLRNELSLLAQQAGQQETRLTGQAEQIADQGASFPNWRTGDVHRRLRAPLDDSVSGLALRRVSRENRELCAALISAFAGRGQADLVAEYAGLIPMLAIGKMAGLDLAPGRELLACLHKLFGAAEEAQAANQRYEEILTGLMRSRQQSPGDDLTSVFVSHKNLHDDVEVLQTMVLMVAAGLESTMAWIAQTLRLMLTDPRFAGRMRGGRLGVDDALDEVLCRDPRRPTCRPGSRSATSNWPASRSPRATRSSSAWPPRTPIRGCTATTCGTKSGTGRTCPGRRGRMPALPTSRPGSSPRARSRAPCTCSRTST